VAQRTGRLVAEWHRVGFVHGVLNTDNMSILGETIGALWVHRQPANWWIGAGRCVCALTLYCLSERTARDVAPLSILYRRLRAVRVHRAL
jgi:hypothetical protein